MVAHYFEGLLRSTSWAMCRPAGNRFDSGPRHAICLIANCEGLVFVATAALIFISDVSVGAQNIY